MFISAFIDAQLNSESHVEGYCIRLSYIDGKRIPRPHSNSPTGLMGTTNHVHKAMQVGAYKSELVMTCCTGNSVARQQSCSYSAFCHMSDTRSPPGGVNLGDSPDLD